MKKIYSCILLFCSLFFLSCKEVLDILPIGTGTLTVWVASDLGHGKISVYVDDTYRGEISKYYSKGVMCNEGDVNTTLSTGIHSYKGIAQDNTTWTGSITIPRDDCKMLQLTR